MTIKKMTVATLAAAAVLGLSTAALAANAYMTRDSDVYRNPSADSAVVNAVEEDEAVTVTECNRNWCRIQIPGRDGWVRRNRLATMEEDEGPAPGRNPGRDPGGLNLGITIGPEGPQLSIGGGAGGTPPGGAGPDSGPRACFFSDAGYSGNSFCRAIGSTTNNLDLTGWNDRISSIRLYGRAKVQACTDAFFAGSCFSVESNIGNLGGNNDKISSFDVY